MTGPVSQCPSCGASVSFRWAGAVQTTCEFCDSILVRHGTELERVGKVSEPPPVTSPVQLGTEGAYGGRSFTVVGRIVYGYERGRWSEWHLIFSDGASGWLSDAMDEYSVSFLVEDPGSLPAEEELRPGLELERDGRTYELTDMTPARYRSTEGELPWEYHDRELLTFADLKSPDGGLMTLDYSEDPPLMFEGEYVAFESLRLENLRDEEERTATAEGVRTLSCPNCGSSVTVHRGGSAVNVVCEACASVLDATSPGAEVLQTFEKKAYVQPRIPLGSTGELKGHEYICLGFQIRSMRSEGVTYSWSEYLLHNPERGFRYLTEENGHWNDAITLKSVPEKVSSGSQPVVELHGEKFKHFESANVTTTYVLGEWPWEVRVGDEVYTSDYVSPPRLLSLETTADENVWSVAEYVSGWHVWSAFDLPGSPPEPQGVYANQPSPHQDGAKGVWASFAVLITLFVGLWFARAVVLPNSELVLSERHRFVPPTDSSIVVLGPFTLGGRPSNLAVDVEADVSNNWIYFDYALLDTESGEAREFGREVSFYSGVDGGERWSEGSRKDRAIIPRVPPGEYMLRVAPEARTPVAYDIALRRDVPTTIFYVGTLVLLLLPPAVAFVRHGSFEVQRWSDSEHPIVESE